MVKWWMLYIYGVCLLIKYLYSTKLLHWICTYMVPGVSNIWGLLYLIHEVAEEWKRETTMERRKGGKWQFKASLEYCKKGVEKGFVVLAFQVDLCVVPISIISPCFPPNPQCSSLHISPIVLNHPFPPFQCPSLLVLILSTIAIK